MMRKRLAGCTAAAIAASLMIGAAGTSYAATTVTLAGLGFKTQTKDTETEASQTETAETAADQTEDTQSAETAKQETAQQETAQQETEEAQTEAPETEPDRSMVDTTGFAKTDNYINVRASGDSEGEVLGTLSNNDSVYIEDVDENGWYKIRSGNLEGYVAGYLIATGDDAQELADSTGYTYATVGAETVNVRADASEDSEVVDMAAQGAELEVVEDLGDWVKVVTPDGIYGYVSADYTDTQTVYPTGETVQEQSEREEAEYLEAVAQQEAEAQAQAEQQAAAESAMVSSMGSDVQALYQAYLEAQDAAMTATDENDAETKADAAIAAYNAYIAAANGDTSAAQTTDTASDAQQTYTEASAAQETYTETAQTSSDTQTDAGTTSGDVDSLYQAYLTAQEAAMSPVDEADATAKANAAIEAYNAYLAALGSSETVATLDTTAADTASSAETVSTDTAAEDTQTDTQSAEETQTVQTEAAQTEAAASSTLGQQIANYAVQFVGNPYVYGGASLTGGADCSGFTMAVFAHFGIGLPHNAAAQSGCGTSVSLSDLQPGDLLFYNNGGGIGHVTLYIGGGQVVHASNPESGIKISAYNYRTPVCAVRCW